jgi:tryptophan-rich sensory protein
MKKLPFCALSAGALFVVVGTLVFLSLAPHPEPFGLLFPLVWDVVMVAIGLGVIFRCEVARKAGFVWGTFCMIATLAIGVAAFLWLLPQHPESLGTRRIVFMILTVAFGVIFSTWQLIVLRSPTALPWGNHVPPPPRMSPMNHRS